MTKPREPDYANTQPNSSAKASLKIAGTPEELAMEQSHA
jgi:hypothetical protein